MNTNAWQQFIDIIGKLPKEELKDWFDILLTPAEQDDVADRVRIVEGLLSHELPQRDLAAKLNVSISKITRGSNALKRLSPQKIKWLEALFRG